MKKLLPYLLFSIVFHPLMAQQEPRLYPIVENGLYGYIDKTGKTIITPQFKSVGAFSEGLAPARLNGTYGFIEGTGKFVISPKYDFACPFANGLAKVYLKSKPYIIDRNGIIQFEHKFKEILGFNKANVSIVKAASNKYGVINKKGQIIVDAIYDRIDPFENNVAVVYRQKGEYVFEKGVVNVKGKFIIPFGKYSEITSFKKGFARVEWNDKNAILDTLGRLKFIWPSENKGWLQYDCENYAEENVVVSFDRDNFGAIDSKGRIVFKDKGWEEILPFNNHRTFAKNKDDNWYLINQRGEILNNEHYISAFYNFDTSCPGPVFENGIAFVKTKVGISAIDTSGNVLITKDFWYNLRFRTKSFLFFDNGNGKNGFWNTKNGTFVEPKFDYIDYSDIDKELIKVVENHKNGYIDHDGLYVWQEKNLTVSCAVDVDFMNEGYFYASSPYRKELAGLDGWGDSNNLFKPIKSESDFNSLRIRVEKYLQDSVKKNCVKLFVENYSPDTVFFNAQNSRMPLKFQALDKNNMWNDIEELSNSWCGNSYHTLFLPKNNFWEFNAINYEGEFKTKIRAQLIYKTSKDGEEKFVFSNEVEGSINPGQFWRKREYFPSNLMDSK